MDEEYKVFVEKDPVYNQLVNGIVGKIIAKHFFELGLNASNPLTWEDISDIDDLLDESLPSSFSDELELKGYYEEVLKRFKAKKGE